MAALVANAVSTPKLVPIAWGPDGNPTQYGVSGSAPGTKLVTLLHDMGAEFVEGWLEQSPELFNGKKNKITLVDAVDPNGDPVATPPTDPAGGTETTGLSVIWFVLGSTTKAMSSSWRTLRQPRL